MSSLFRTVDTGEPRQRRVRRRPLDPWHTALGIAATVLLVVGLVIVVLESPVGVGLGTLLLLIGTAAGICWLVLGSLAWSRANR